MMDDIYGEYDLNPGSGALGTPYSLPAQDPQFNAIANGQGPQGALPFQAQPGALSPESAANIAGGGFGDTMGTIWDAIKSGAGAVSGGVNSWLNDKNMPLRAAMMSSSPGALGQIGKGLMAGSTLQSTQGLQQAQGLNQTAQAEHQNLTNQFIKAGFPAYQRAITSLQDDPTYSMDQALKDIRSSDPETQQKAHAYLSAHNLDSSKALGASQ